MRLYREIHTFIIKIKTKCRKRIYKNFGIMVTSGEREEEIHREISLCL